MGIIETPETPAAEKPAETAAPQPATAAPTVDSAVANVVKDAVALKDSLQTKLGNWLKDVYSSNKILFYTIIPIMGLIYLVIKFHNVIIDVLLGSSKELLKEQREKDAALAQQANATKSQADALVAKADALPGQEKPVDSNWDKK